VRLYLERQAEEGYQSEYVSEDARSSNAVAGVRSGSSHYLRVSLWRGGQSRAAGRSCYALAAPRSAGTVHRR
jgi:hypothetical protein